jgi:hypothetical protein
VASAEARDGGIQLALVLRSVVGQDALDADPEAREFGSGDLERRDRSARPSSGTSTTTAYRLVASTTDSRWS